MVVVGFNLIQNGMEGETLCVGKKQYGDFCVFKCRHLENNEWSPGEVDLDCCLFRSGE